MPEMRAFAIENLEGLVVCWLRGALFHLADFETKYSHELEKHLK